MSDETPDETAVEVRKLRRLIIGIVVVVVLGAGAFAYQARLESGRERGRDTADCIIRAVEADRSSDNC